MSILQQQVELSPKQHYFQCDCSNLVLIWFLLPFGEAQSIWPLFCIAIQSQHIPAPLHSIHRAAKDRVIKLHTAPVAGSLRAEKVATIFLQDIQGRGQCVEVVSGLSMRVAADQSCGIQLQVAGGWWQRGGQ
jgi:hypothetical protein